MKKTTLLLGMGTIMLSFGQARAQEIIPEGMKAITDANEIQLTTQDNVNRSKNEKPLVVLPDGSLVFSATTAETGEELFICKDDQVTLIKDIEEGSTGSDPKWMTVVGDKIFFAATTSEYGMELWITDGTAEGTKLVKDIYEGDMGSELFGLTAFNGKCLFFAKDFDSELDGYVDKTNGDKWLWVSDGTEEGTERIADVATREGIDGMSGYLVQTSKMLFFIGYDRQWNETLWVTDGTAEGTKALKDIYPVPASDGDFETEAATIDWLTPVENEHNDKLVVFRANTLDNTGKNIGSEIWYSDGTAEGTQWVGTDYAAGEENGVPKNTEFAFPIEYEGKVYFRAKDGIHGCEPGVTDFTAEGTHYICDINFWDNDPKYDSWGPEYPYIWKGYMFCQANGSYYYPADTYHDSGYCLWRYNMEEGGVTPTAENGLIGFQYQSNWTDGVEIFPGNNKDEVRYFTPYNGKLYFRAQDVDNNHELWVLDDVDATPAKVADFSGDALPHSFTVANGSFYFITTTTAVLYKYTTEGTGLRTPTAAGKTLSIYPNPVMDIVNINIADELAGVEIFDLSGKRIMQETGNLKSLNVSNLSTGIYMLRAKTINGEIHSAKLTK